jgi:hypothetical protein
LFTVALLSATAIGDWSFIIWEGMIYIDGFIDPLGSDFSFAGLLGERCFVYMQQVFVLSFYLFWLHAGQH